MTPNDSCLLWDLLLCSLFFWELAPLSDLLLMKRTQQTQRNVAFSKNKLIKNIQVNTLGLLFFSGHFLGETRCHFVSLHSCVWRSQPQNEFEVESSFLLQGPLSNSVFKWDCSPEWQLSYIGNFMRILEPDKQLSYHPIPDFLKLR